MQAPAHKAPALAQEARGAVEKLLSCLEHQAAACAAGVDKDKRSCALGILAFTRGFGTQCGPSTLCESEGSVIGAKHVMSGIAMGCLAGKATEQCITRKVEMQTCSVVADGQGDARAGVFGIDVGASAGGLKQAVADGVFYAQCAKAGVAQVVVGTASGDGDSDAFGQHLFPGNLARTGIEGIGVAGAKAVDDYQDTAGQTRPEAGALAVDNLTRKRNAALELAHLREGQGVQLIGKGVFKTGGTAGKEFHGVCLSQSMCSGTLSHGWPAEQAASQRLHRVRFI